MSEPRLILPSSSNTTVDASALTTTQRTPEENNSMHSGITAPEPPMHTENTSSAAVEDPNTNGSSVPAPAKVSITQPSAGTVTANGKKRLRDEPGNRGQQQNKNGPMDHGGKDEMDNQRKNKRNKKDKEKK